MAHENRRVAPCSAASDSRVRQHGSTGRSRIIRNPLCSSFQAYRNTLNPLLSYLYRLPVNISMVNLFYEYLCKFCFWPNRVFAEWSKGIPVQDLGSGWSRDGQDINHTKICTQYLFKQLQVYCESTVKLMRKRSILMLTTFSRLALTLHSRSFSGHLTLSCDCNYGILLDKNDLEIWRAYTTKKRSVHLSCSTWRDRKCSKA